MAQLLRIAFILLLAAFPSLGEERTWTSTEGKTFEGSLQSATAEAATIRRSDGRTFDVPVAMLSEADRRHVETMLADLQRSKGFEEGPFADRITGEWVKVPKEESGLVYQIFGSPKLKRLEEPVPLFVHLHGAGARADDVETGKVEIAPQMLAGEELYEEHPCVILVPLCPPDVYWGDKVAELEALVDRVTAALPIDRKRIYLSGYSMGAQGIGRMLDSRPDHYAAALFADGAVKSEWVETQDAALWFTFSGERELEEAKKVAEAYTAAGKTAHFEGFPDHTHNQIHWTLAKTEGVFDWCFSQERK